MSIPRNTRKKRKHLGKHIYHHVRGLNSREFRVLVLFYKKGYSNYKIGRTLNVDPSSIAGTHKRAIKKIAKYFAVCQWATKMGLTPEKVSAMLRQFSKKRNRREEKTHD